METSTFIIVSSWIILTFFISNARGNVVQSSFQFLNTHNDMDLESIIIVADGEGNDTIYEYISMISFLEHTSVPMLFIKVDEKMQDNLENSLEKSSRTLIILYDYETSKRVQDMFANLPSSYLVNNCWLLIFHTYFDESEIKKIMTDRLDLKQDIQLNSQIYSLTGSNEVANLLEIYRPCGNHSLSFKMLAHLSNGTMTKGNHDFIWDRRSNLELCELTIAYKTWSLLRLLPNTTDHTYKQKQVLQANGKTFYGPETHMFNLLLSALNFTISWIHPADNHWGTIDQKTRKWNGMVSLLANNEADMSIASLIVTQLRGTVISYSTPLFRVQYNILMNKPDTSAAWNVYAAAFDGLYWIA